MNIFNLVKELPLRRCVFYPIAAPGNRHRRRGKWSWEQDSTVRKELLTFVVGGGGYTGIETMAAVNDLVRTSVKHYPKVSPGEISTLIIEPGDRLMSELSSDLAAFGQQKLEERGVQAWLKTKIARAAGNFVELEHGERIPTRMLIWAGGITPNPIIGILNCKRGKHGGIIVEKTCAVPDQAGIWALSDCAEIPSLELRVRMYLPRRTQHARAP